MLTKLELVNKIKDIKARKDEEFLTLHEGSIDYCTTLEEIDDANYIISENASAKSINEVLSSTTSGSIYSVLIRNTEDIEALVYNEMAEYVNNNKDKLLSSQLMPTYHHLADEIIKSIEAEDVHGDDLLPCVLKHVKNKIDQLIHISKGNQCKGF